MEKDIIFYGPQFESCHIVYFFAGFFGDSQKRDSCCQRIHLVCFKEAGILFEIFSILATVYSVPQLITTEGTLQRNPKVLTCDKGVALCAIFFNLFF